MTSEAFAFVFTWIFFLSFTVLLVPHLLFAFFWSWFKKIIWTT